MTEKDAIPNTKDGKRHPEPVRALFLFPEAGDPHVNESIEKVLHEFPHVEVKRWDKLSDVENIMRDLEERIRRSDLILVVLDTVDNDFNLNTLYELGFAHGLRRRVISVMSQANKRKMPSRSGRISCTVMFLITRRVRPSRASFGRRAASISPARSTPLSNKRTSLP